MNLSNGSVSKQRQSSNMNIIVFSSSNTDYDGQACIDQINESAFLSFLPKERKKYKLCNTYMPAHGSNQVAFFPRLQVSLFQFEFQI